MTLSNVNSPNSLDIISASSAKIVTGVSAGAIGFAAANNLVIQLEITASSGTIPTLDLIIQDTVDGTNWFTIATFTQKVTTGVFAERVSTAFTDQIRASWTITGTTPSFTFSVKTFADA